MVGWIRLRLESICFRQGLDRVHIASGKVRQGLQTLIGFRPGLDAV